MLPPMTEPREGPQPDWRSSETIARAGLLAIVVGVRRHFSVVRPAHAPALNLLPR